MGQSMPMSGSFQAMPDSACGPYVPVVKYSMSTTSERAQKPRAKEAGAQSWRWFSSLATIDS